MIGSVPVFDLYHVLLFVHIVAVIAWVGGDIMLLLLAQQVRANGSQEEMTALLGRIERFSKTFFAPLSVVVLAMGMWMAIIGGIMAAPWVSTGFLGIFISAGIGMGYLAPKSRELRALIEARGKDAPEAVLLGNRLLLWSRLDIAVLFVIVVVMVFKPGAV